MPQDLQVLSMETVLTHHKAKQLPRHKYLSKHLYIITNYINLGFVVSFIFRKLLLRRNPVKGKLISLYFPFSVSFNLFQISNVFIHTNKKTQR